jgi:excisionase family DNA binding protein
MTTEPDEKREYITTPQASELANLSANYIATLLRKKKLEGFQLGRDWFVYTDSLNQFLQTTRKPGPKGPRKKAVNPPDDAADHHLSSSTIMK